jgi:hypothetical protein
MIRTPVSSSVLRSVGYDETNGTLEVEFLHGGIYEYASVPVSRYSGLMRASSKGEYFDEYIKKPGYAFRKIG